VQTLFGVNLPWLFGSYGHDLAPNENVRDWGCDFDTLDAYRPLVEARELGFRAVRIWLCERAEGIVTDGGVVTGVHPTLLESVKVLEECARLVGVRIYWTLFDGNSWKRERDPFTHRIVTDRDETLRFAERVAVPIARALDPEIAVGLEVINEPETMTSECISAADEETVEWNVLGRAIATIGDAVRAERPDLAITAGTMHVFLPSLWKSGAKLDAIDIHMYHRTGGLPSRDDLAKYVGDPRIASDEIPLIAGECGLPDDAPAGAEAHLVDYLRNAQSNGYRAAFLWRLEGVLIAKQGARGETAVAGLVRRALRELT
jgi:hypothetical protein